MASTSSHGAESNDMRQVALHWTAAVASADVRALARLMTDDIVVIHGHGRTIEGREAVISDFASSFQDFRVEQKIDSEETVVAGDWAFDRATVHTSIEARAGGDRRQFESRTITILRKQDGGSWRVARSIGVMVQQRAMV